MSTETTYARLQSGASHEQPKLELTVNPLDAPEQTDGNINFDSPEQVVADALATDPGLRCLAFALAVQPAGVRTALLDDFAGYMAKRLETGNGNLPVVENSTASETQAAALPLLVAEVTPTQKPNKVVEMIRWLQARSQVVPEFQDSHDGNVSWSTTVDPTRLKTYFADRPELTIQKRVLSPFEAMTDSLFNGQAYNSAIKGTRETAILTADVLEILAKNFGTWLRDDEALPQQTKLKFLDTLATVKYETLPELKEGLSSTATELQTQAEKLFILSYYAYINSGNKLVDAKQELSKANPNRKAVIASLAALAAASALLGAPANRNTTDPNIAPASSDRTVSLSSVTEPSHEPVVKATKTSVASILLPGVNYGK